MAAVQPDLVAVVEQSPQAAAAHDRAGWAGLFTADGRVEDPVGSRPHVGAEQIGRFFDTFIDPREITFHRDLDIVRGSAVVRDLELEVAMGASVTMHIPAFLRYDLRQDGDEWKIARLRAYWELGPMMSQFLRNGLSALPAGAQLSQALLRNQRLTGIAGFLAGFRRPRTWHKSQVEAFVLALARQDTEAAGRALSPGATTTYGDDQAVDLTELSARLAGARPVKLVGAGSTVAVSVTSASDRGVIFADPTRSGDAIARVRYFPS